MDLEGINLVWAAREWEKVPTDRRNDRDLRLKGLGISVGFMPRETEWGKVEEMVQGQIAGGLACLKGGAFTGL